MVVVTLLSQGYDQAGEYWTTEAFQNISRRFQVWQKAHEGIAFGVRYHSPDGPYLGHIDSIFYDPITEELRAEIDLSTDKTGNAADIVGQGKANPFYKAMKRNDFGQIIDAYIGAVVIFVPPQGVKFSPGG